MSCNFWRQVLRKNQRKVLTPIPTRVIREHESHNTSAYVSGIGVLPMSDAQSPFPLASRYSQFEKLALSGSTGALDIGRLPTPQATSHEHAHQEEKPIDVLAKDPRASYDSD